MSVRFTGSISSNPDALVAQQMANNTIQQYRIGYEELQRQLTGDDTVDTGPDAIGLVDPVHTIRLSKQKPLKSVMSGSKGYNAQKMSQQVISVSKKTNTNADKAREFIAQTRALDNDLDHALALMKLNNKDEFYKDGTSGDIESGLYKKLIKDATEPSQEELDLKASMKKLLTEYSKAKKIYDNSGDDDEEEEERLEDMKKEYDQYSNILKEMQAEAAASTTSIPKKEDIIKSLVDEGLTIDGIRNSVPGSISSINKMNESTYNSTKSGVNKDRRSKNGLRIVSETDVSNLLSDLILLTKKIANAINVLTPLAQTMITTRFQGITHTDRLMLQEMYKDMDEKLYVLTSLNNVNNTMFIKLDKSFDKLYDTVKRGLDSYNGGSMAMMSSHIPGIYVPPAHSYVHVDNWNYL